MKTPLRYQVTRNDCGPTSMTNALSYLLGREEFPPEVLEYVYSVMLDKYRGEQHPGGTSCWAMRFFGHWLNDTRRTTGLPIEAHQLRGEEVQIGDGTELLSRGVRPLRPGDGRQSRRARADRELPHL